MFLYPDIEFQKVVTCHSEKKVPYGNKESFVLATKLKNSFVHRTELKKGFDFVAKFETF